MNLLDIYAGGLNPGYSNSGASQRLRDDVRKARTMTHSPGVPMAPAAKATLDFMADPIKMGGLAADFTPVVGGIKGTIEEAQAGNPWWAAANAASVPLDLMTAGTGSALLKGGLSGLGLMLGRIEDIPSPVWNQKSKSIPVGFNPTRREINELLKEERDLRALIHKNGDMHMWPASGALHADVGAYYGLKPSDVEHGLLDASSFR